jgi:small subunit ribosomal protein S1
MSKEVKDESQNPKEKVQEEPKEQEDIPAGIKPGQVFKLEDAPDILDDKISEKDPAMMELYEQTFERVNEGDIIKGTIVALLEKDVVVDVGFKSEGLIPKEEFIDLETLKVGDQIEAYLENSEDVEGQVMLSRRKVYFIRTWENLIDKHNKDEIVKGRIVRRIKGGFVVDLGGVDAFLPGSQVDVKPIRDFDAFVGQELDLKIVKVNDLRKNIVVSRRVIIEKTLESKRSEILGTLEKGQVRRGMIKNITDFGVFIDLGGVDGLLHITDLSWGRVNHPSEVVKLDQEIDVMILDYDENKSRISLGLKQLQPHPWEKVEERFPVGKQVKGKVASITDYGAFVELEKGIEGLIHVSEMSWSQHIKNPSQVLKEGDNVKAVVLSIEADDRKISLGLKQLTPDPWEEIGKKYPIESKHSGIVRNLTPFGAFIELEEGVDGLVHISDLSWTKKVRHPSEVVKKGQEINVIVLDISKEERRIALGHKQVESNPWDTFEDAYKVGTETQGTISRLIDKGVIVTLPLGVDAFVPLNHLGKSNVKRASDHFKVGDNLPLKSIEFDKENKRIVLSVSEYLKNKEQTEVDSYMGAHNFTTTTMGELVKDVPEVLEGVPGEEQRRELPARKPGSKKKVKEDSLSEAEIEGTKTSEKSEKKGEKITKELTAEKMEKEKTETKTKKETVKKKTEKKVPKKETKKNDKEEKELKKEKKDTSKESKSKKK